MSQLMPELKQKEGDRKRARVPIRKSGGGARGEPGWEGRGGSRSRARSARDGWPGRARGGRSAAGAPAAAAVAASAGGPRSPALRVRAGAGSVPPRTCRPSSWAAAPSRSHCRTWSCGEGGRGLGAEGGKWGKRGGVG